MSKKKKKQVRKSSSGNTRSVKFRASSSPVTKQEEILNEAVLVKEVTEETAEKETVDTAPKENIAVETLVSEEKEERKEEKDNGKPKASKTKLWLAGVIAALLALFTAVLLSILIYSADTEVEIGGRPDFSKFEHGLGKVICTRPPDGNDIDTSKQGIEKTEIEFFGFIKKNLHVSVVDKTPPEVETRNVICSTDEKAEPGDFVVSSSDMTEVVYSLEGLDGISGSGEYPLVLKACDEAGNVTESDVILTLEDGREPLVFEYGLGRNDITDCIYESYPDIYHDSIDNVPSECGVHKLRAVAAGGYRIFTVTIKDTTPPSGDALSFDIMLGDVLAPEDFIENLYDESSYSVSFAEEPDFEKTGKQTVKTVATDIYGNTTEFSSDLAVHNIGRDIRIEAGTKYDDIVLLVLGDERETLKLDEAFSSSGHEVGEYDVGVTGEYSTFGVKINITDTVPPVLTLRNRVVFVGQEISPELLVYYLDDATPCTLSFREEPRNDKPHSEYVTVVAEDSAGNISEASAYLYIYEDVEAPAIYGVSAVYLNLGETASYLDGVYAVDNCDGPVSVTVDASNVDTSNAGVYYIKYYAKDKAGNERTITGVVNVSSITPDTVNNLADGILSQIVTSSMTQREKARAIYDWARVNIRYKTSTSYLMGHFTDAAYSGFRTRGGNCYVYYAVSSVLLTRAGIENMEIRRNSETNPHYWNLVKIDGSWYHFDTCPHYSQYPIDSFLLTDSEVNDYSVNAAVGYYSFDPSLYPATP